MRLASLPDCVEAGLSGGYDPGAHGEIPKALHARRTVKQARRQRPQRRPAHLLGRFLLDTAQGGERLLAVSERVPHAARVGPGPCAALGSRHEVDVQAPRDPYAFVGGPEGVEDAGDVDSDLRLDGVDGEEPAGGLPLRPALYGFIRLIEHG